MSILNSGKYKLTSVFFNLDKIEDKEILVNLFSNEDKPPRLSLGSRITSSSLFP